MDDAMFDVVDKLEAYRKTKLIFLYSLFVSCLLFTGGVMSMLFAAEDTSNVGVTSVVLSVLLFWFALMANSSRKTLAQLYMREICLVLEFEHGNEFASDELRELLGVGYAYDSPNVALVVQTFEQLFLKRESVAVVERYLKSPEKYVQLFSTAQKVEPVLGSEQEA